MPRQGEETFKYKDFVGWTTTTLKDFLALRGPSQSGKKEELVARAFGAYELNVKKISQEEIYAKIRDNKRPTNLDCVNMAFKTQTCFQLSHGKIIFTSGRMLTMVCFSAIFYESKLSMLII